MNRAYSMYVTVSWKPKPGENIKETAQEIGDAMRKQWPFDDQFCYCDEDGIVELSDSADGNLCGGESEEEFADRLAKAVWEVAAGVKIEVNATCLEDIPYDTYTFNEEDYQEWKQQ